MKFTKSLSIIILFSFSNNGYAAQCPQSIPPHAISVLTVVALYTLAYSCKPQEATGPTYLCMQNAPYLTEPYPFPIRCSHIQSIGRGELCFQSLTQRELDALYCPNRYKLLSEKEIEIVKARQKGFKERQNAAEQNLKKYLAKQEWELKNHKKSCKMKPKRFERYNQKCIQRSEHWQLYHR